MTFVEKWIQGMRDRSLWQVAGLYAAGAWVALQVVDVFADAFDLPGRFAAMALVLLIAGFPVVLATAWLQKRSQRSGQDAELGADDPAVRRLLTWRNVLATGVGLFAIWGVVVTGWLLTRETPGPGAGRDLALEVSPSAIAVLPFSVRGSPNYEHLGEGMVSLLGIKLDGAGDLRSVDSRALLSHIAREGGPSEDPEQAAATAARLGAGLFVLGDVVESGGHLQITAGLYRTDDWAEAIVVASAAGDDAFVLVDEVATDLLAGVEGGPGARVRRIAAVTTSSLDAFRAYLEGEAEFRVFEFQAAFDAFERAVEIDTLYAMAYYRLSVAAEWLTRAEDAQRAAEMAYRHASRLPERDRQLLEAFLAWRRGEHFEAERRYRAIVGTYPTDVEAWFQLGEVLHHANPLHGRSFAESREAFERVMVYEPMDMAAMVHLIRMAAREGRLTEMDSLANRFLSVNSEADRRYEVQSIQVLAHGDPVRADSLMEAYASLSDLHLGQVAWNANLFTGNRRHAEDAAALLTRRDRFTPEVWTTGHTMRAHSLYARGKVGEALAEADSIASYDPVSALELRAFLHLVPLFPVDLDALEELRAEVDASDPASASQSGNRSFFFNVPETRHGVAKLYLSGSLAAETGDLETARARAAELAVMEPPPESGSLTLDLAAGVEARAAWAAGSPGAALEAIEQVRSIGFYQLAMACPWDGRVWERYARGMLLEAAGRHEEALGWFAHLGELGSAGVAYMPAAAMRQGQIYEALGRPDEAAAQYARFIEMWRDADPELQPIVEEVQARLDRLVPDGSVSD